MHGVVAHYFTLAAILAERGNACVLSQFCFAHLLAIYDPSYVHVCGVTSLAAILPRLAWSDDYQDVCLLYPRKSFWLKFYSAARFLICPFARIESFVPKSGVVVDVGCGYGLFANLLAIRSAARQVIGCDIDAARIEVASSSVGDRTNVSFFVSDTVATLPPCDAVTIVDVLHHVSLDIRLCLLKEVARKLRSGGSLIVKDLDKVPRAKYLWNYAQDLLMTRFEACYFLSKAEMCELLEQVGFTVVAQPFLTHSPYAHILYCCTKKHENDAIEPSLGQRKPIDKRPLRSLCIVDEPKAGLRAESASRGSRSSRLRKHRGFGK